MRNALLSTLLTPGFVLIATIASAQTLYPGASFPCEAVVRLKLHMQ